MKVLTLAGCSFFLAAAASAATVDSAAFRYRLDLDLPAGQPPEDLYAFRLPAELFRETLESLDDLRLADPRGQAIPFALTRRTELTAATQRVDVAAARSGFREVAASNAVEIDYTLEAGKPGPTGLRIDTPLRDFEKQVSVYASPDGSAWTPVVDGAVIFDASRFMDVSRRDVRFPEIRARHLRLVLHDVTDSTASPVSELSRFAGRAGSGEPAYTDRQSTIRNRDFRIDHVAFFRDDVAQSVARPRLVAYPATNVQAKSENGKTVVRFESGRVPLTRITVRSASRNYARAFALYADGPDRRFDQPRPVLARGTLRHFAFRTLDVRETSFSLPESRHGTYALEIEDGDNPPLQVEGLTLEGPELQALFLAPPASRVRLYAVDPAASKPRFDTTVLNLALDRGLMGHAVEAPGPLEPNPDWKKTRGFTFNKKAALGGALTVVALVLGAALFKAARRMEPGGPPAT